LLLLKSLSGRGAAIGIHGVINTVYCTCVSWFLAVLRYGSLYLSVVEEGKTARLRLITLFLGSLTLILPLGGIY